MRAGSVKRCSLGAAAFAIALGGFGSTALAASTVDNAQGRTEQGNGRSICYFSGLNDEPSDPHEGGRVQSFGQIVKLFGPLGGVPGTECNPTKGPDLKG